jgi:hypothetical protein
MQRAQANANDPQRQPYDAFLTQTEAERVALGAKNREAVERPHGKTEKTVTGSEAWSVQLRGNTAT